METELKVVGYAEFCGVCKGRGKGAAVPEKGF